MPTGYTCNIHKGQTFNEYALACARAFGACIDMRDSTTSEAIPEEFFPSLYHKEALAAAQANLLSLYGMLSSDLEDAAQADYDTSILHYRQRMKEAAETKIKFLAMEAQAKAYVPPTPEHQGLKDFMLNQLQISATDYSTEYDREPIKQSAGEWLQDKLTQCHENIARHTKQWQKEQDTVAQRNEWVKHLRESLNVSPSSVVPTCRKCPADPSKVCDYCGYDWK